MGALEEKRKELGINDLEFKEQKKMYNEFVDIGGEIVDLSADPRRKMNDKLENWIVQKEDEQKRRLLEQKRQEEEAARQKALQAKRKFQKLEEQRYKQSQVDIPNKIDESYKTPKKQEHNPTEDYFSRVAAKIICILYGVFNLWGSHFSRKFWHLTMYDLQNSLLESQQILVSILHQDKEFTQRIKKMLSETGFPYYFELIYRFYHIYDEQTFSFFSSMRHDQSVITKTKPYFIQLFKNILIINRFHPSLIMAFEKALMEEKSIRNLNDAVYFSNLRRIQKCYTFIFYKFFPKILNLIDYYYKDDLYRGKKVSFRDYLGIKEEDTLGFLTNFWKEEEEKERVRKEQEEKDLLMSLERQRLKQEEISQSIDNDDMPDELKALPEAVGKGIKLIRESVRFQDLLNYYNDIKDSRMILPVNDKAFLSYIILEHFDKEFSFLFITSSVHYNIYFDRGLRKDIKSVMKDLYFHIDEIYKKLNEYVKILMEMKKSNATNYMRSKDQFAKIQNLNVQRSHISRLIRTETKLLIEKFNNHFRIILEDNAQIKSIIQNPEEVISYDTNIAGKKRTYQDKIIEIFRKAYYFSSAILYLTGDGELGGLGVSLMKPLYLPVVVPLNSDKDPGMDGNA